jgi:hypothetical protein
MRGMDETGSAFLLPPEITKGATLHGNEYRWKPTAFPDALRNAETLGYGCLGGQFQFVWANDPKYNKYELYWLCADSSPYVKGEPWPEYCHRSCSEVLDVFRRLMAETDFRAKVPWINPTSELVFVAYFVTEAEIAGDTSGNR